MSRFGDYNLDELSHNIEDFIHDQLKNNISLDNIFRDLFSAIELGFTYGLADINELIDNKRKMQNRMNCSRFNESCIIDGVEISDCQKCKQFILKG